LIVVDTNVVAYLYLSSSLITADQKIVSRFPETAIALRTFGRP
jgi:hypothetical protein